MLEAFLLFLLCPLLSGGQHLSDDAIFTINGKKTLNTLNEKFISFSVDPAILLTGLNLSNTSLQMAKLLSPAFVRIAGPSTEFVKYERENWNEKENEFVIVTPSMWFGINEWLAIANLTPVFGINDRVTGKEGWNPQEAIEVLDLADKFNSSCYWQLGFDCSNKSESQYVSDLKRLQHVLDTHPDKTNQWKIVGSDLSHCISDPKKILDELETVLSAVVLENYNSQFLLRINEFNLLKPRVPLWLTSSKSDRPVSFSSAITWAKETGEAAKNGFEVILKQPRLHEIYSETPPFWVSFFHKMLMGRHVLDVKATINQPEVSVFAHCAKNQNDFIRSGAMTILVVNNHTTNHTVLLKFGTLLMKNTEVRSYVLTSESEDSTDVFLNGDKLSLDQFDDGNFKIEPKLRRARIMNYLSLFLPPKSIGFFVLPGAQIPICANEETDLNLIMEEIKEDQNIPFSVDEVSMEITPRFNVRRTPSLRELQAIMERELESDEKFYKQSRLRKVKSYDDSNSRNFFIHRMRNKIEDQKKPELKHEELKKFDYTNRRKEEPKTIFELELTSGEIRKVLADRAKVKAAKKNILFTSEELEEIMNKATNKFLNNKNASIRIRKKTKREIPRDKKHINMKLLKLKSYANDRRKILREILNNKKIKTQKRERRDINLDLLRIKAEKLHKNNKNKKLKKKFENLDEKQATIRNSSEQSEEFVESEEVDEIKSNLPDKDVFAELAEPEENLNPTQTKAKNIFKTKTHHFRKPTIPKIQTPIVDDYKSLTNPSVSLETDFELTSTPDDFDYDCIHEFSAKLIPRDDNKKNSAELFELSQQLVDNSKKETLKITNRGQDFEKQQDIIFKDKDFGDSKNEFLEDDYEDLESNENNPVRLRRDLKEKSDFTLRDTYDPLKLSIDENLKEQQFKFLKEYLAQKKKLDFINRNHKLIAKRKTRSIFPRNSFNERYKSLTEGLKIWKASDILSLKNSKKRFKRGNDQDVDSVENEIGNFVNELMKDTKKFKSGMNFENGDYQLVFPNNDKIEVSENQRNTEVKLILHTESTSPMFIKENNENTTKSNIQKILKKNDGNVWKKLLKKLTKFFRGLGTKLKKCIVDDFVNSVSV